MRTIPKGPVDTRKKLREVMDRLVLATAEQLEALPAQKFDEKLSGLATITKYLTTINREPEQPEGADLGEYRERLNRLSVVRGGGRGAEPDGDGDSDDRDAEPSDDDAADDSGPGEATDPDPEPRAA
jgi:hypothetical protein